MLLVALTTLFLMIARYITCPSGAGKCMLERPNPREATDITQQLLVSLVREAVNPSNQLEDIRLK